MKKYIVIICMAFVVLIGYAQSINMEINMSETQVASGPIVEIKTTLGDIKVQLYDDTPLHRDNFLKLVREQMYDSALFHRVIKDFMIQTGDPGSKNASPTQMLGAGDLGYTVPAEINYPKYFHKYGALAAARTGDEVNPQRASSASQFYIVTGQKFNPQQLKQMESRMTQDALRSHFLKLKMENRDEVKRLYMAHDTVGLENLRQKFIRETELAVKPVKIPENIVEVYSTVGGAPHLDGQYTVFGEVISGMDVVEKIQNVETGTGDRPKEDIRILSVREIK